LSKKFIAIARLLFDRPGILRKALLQTDIPTCSTVRGKVMQDQELMHGMGTAKGHNVMGGPVDKLGEYNFSHRGHILTVHVYLYEYRYRMDKVLPSHVHLNQYNQHGLLASLVSQKARKQLTPPPPV